MLKDRFAKLLLGEDMSGGGKGVSSALALSNAITNLAGTSFSFNFPRLKQVTIEVILLISVYSDDRWCNRFSASIFGEQTKLQPMPQDRQARWKKEIDWLLSVTDHIVEFVPSQQMSKDGVCTEVWILSKEKNIISTFVR